MEGIAYIFGGIVITVLVGLVVIIGGRRGTHKEEELWHHDSEW